MNGNNNHQRISQRELQALLERLSERDKAILESLRFYKYLMTGQIQRLYFRTAISRLAALRATNRNLLKLEDWRLVTTLKRRIGGVRAGSGSYVWVLTAIGARLLDLLARREVEISDIGKGNDSDKPTRKRHHEPSPVFLQHTLAVAEVAIRLTEIAYRHKVGLLERQVEPDCWRAYTNIGGTTSILKPDLFAVTLGGVGGDSDEDYEDHWFIEVDLATESPAVVVRKCQQYIAYWNSDEEQKRCGVFPLVVWIVPDEKRKESLAAHIAENLPDGKGLFAVVTLGEFEPLVLRGAAQ
jgi:hypothetical protein